VRDVKTVHPELEELAAFGHGRLQPDEQARVARHVAECETCCQALRDMPDDTLVERLRRGESARDTSRAQADLSTCAFRPSAADGSDSHAPPPELLDHPRYRIVKLHGAGGMGVVYQAEHKLMERQVALKVISRQLTSEPAAVERFRLEVKAAARLAHRNIVAAHDAEKAGDFHFLVMEFVDGISLARQVEAKGPLSVLQACNVVRQAALGLQHAFECGMVHRDIKPQNLMLTRSGHVKILDFGLARLAREREPVSVDSAGDAIANAATQLTASGALLGAPDYIAPEQITDSRLADVRSDIYSLGCTMYFLLAGRVPFPESSVFDKLNSHMERAPKPLAKLRRDLPTEVARIVARMMAKDPSRRFQSPVEVAQALAPFAKPSSHSAGAAPAATSTAHDLNAAVPDLAAPLLRELAGGARAARRGWHRSSIRPSRGLLAPPAL